MAPTGTGRHLKKIGGIVLSLLVFALAGCDSGKLRIDPEKTVNPAEAVAPGQFSEEKSLRIAVGAMITPREGLAFYRKCLDYIQDKIEMPVEYVDKESYAEINDMLKTGKLDVAFVCSGPFVDGINDFGLRPLVSPQAYGKTVYFSYVIVAKDSPIVKFEDLRGKKFAFTDPQSHTGTLVPTYMLARMNETPDSFFTDYDYTYAHDKSIEAVAMGLVDGAAVDSLVWEYADRKNPVHTSRTRIIFKSPPYGIPPVVVRPGLDDTLVDRLRKIFLNMNNDQKGREILAGMMVERFTPLDNSRYDSVRDMKKWLAERQKNGK